MSTSRDKLELQRRTRLLRENRELDLQRSKRDSKLTKPILDLGDEENPCPTRVKDDENVSMKEALTGYSDDVERSFDEIDLLDWIEELVSGWGVDPHYEEVLAAMKKEPKVLQGFMDNFGPARLRQLVKDELFRIADDKLGSTDYDDPMFQEASGDKAAGELKPWEKSKERKEERQKDIEKGAVKEQADVPLAADARTHRLKFIVELLKFSGSPTSEPIVQAALSKLTPEDSKKLDIFLEKLAHAGDKVSEMLDAAMEKAERSGMRSAGRLSERTKVSGKK